MHQRKFLMSLLMARRQYDVGNILFENDLLDKLVIDAYYNKSRYPLFHILDKVLPAGKQQEYKKYVPKADAGHILSSWKTALKFRMGIRKNKAGDYYKEQIGAYQDLNNIAIKYLSKKKEMPNIYGLDTAALELFQFVKQKDPKAALILEQCVAPRKQQGEMYQHFKDEFNLENADKLIKHTQVLRERELEEWRLADKILVPSAYVADAITSQGISPDKIVFVPYGYNSKLSDEMVLENIEKKFAEKRDKKIVLFAGNAGFRKGVHDLFEVAKTFGNEVEFRIAGKIEENFKLEKPANVTFLGSLQAAALGEQYRQADVFLFPTYLEGSALVTYEAMSWGLPLITTPQSGSIIQDGVDGFICNAGDKKLMAEKLKQLLSDDELRHRFAIAAAKNGKKYSLDTYKKNLLTVLTS